MQKNGFPLFPLAQKIAQCHSKGTQLSRMEEAICIPILLRVAAPAILRQPQVVVVLHLVRNRRKFHRLSLLLRVAAPAILRQPQVVVLLHLVRNRRKFHSLSLLLAAPPWLSNSFSSVKNFYFKWRGERFENRPPCLFLRKRMPFLLHTQDLCPCLLTEQFLKIPATQLVRTRFRLAIVMMLLQFCTNLLPQARQT
jgi:hypothetical protein